ncbi:MAG: transposase, partial [Pseudomonadota bacterium]
MMGDRQSLQSSLFYEFNIEDHVPADHLLRSIDRFVDLSDVRARLEPHYSRIGRPSIDPELMLRMLIVGYSHGIRYRIAQIEPAKPAVSKTEMNLLAKT